jgi:hypothetical protein
LRLRSILLAIALAGAAVPAHADAAAPAETVTTGPPPVAADAPATAQTLVTGDRVVWPAGDGGPEETPFVDMADKSGPNSGFAHMDVGPTHYVVPRAAQPYLFHNLDPALFAVSADSARKAGDADRIPVHLAYRHGVSAADVPGVTVTRTTPDGADGYLTPTSAKKFGAALAAQYSADRKSGTFGTSGLFDKVAAVQPASGGSAGATVDASTGATTTHTLSIEVLDYDGKPLQEGLIGVVNVDDQQKFGQIAQVWGGHASLEGRAALLAWETDILMFDYFYDFTAPMRRVEYVSIGAEFAWRQAILRYAPTVGGIMIDAWRSYHEGEHRTAVWGIRSIRQWKSTRACTLTTRRP